MHYWLLFGLGDVLAMHPAVPQLLEHSPELQPVPQRLLPLEQYMHPVPKQLPELQQHSILFRVHHLNVLNNWRHMCLMRPSMQVLLKHNLLLRMSPGVLPWYRRVLLMSCELQHVQLHSVLCVVSCGVLRGAAFLHLSGVQSAVSQLWVLYWKCVWDVSAGVLSQRIDSVSTLQWADVHVRTLLEFACMLFLLRRVLSDWTCREFQLQKLLGWMSTLLEQFWLSSVLQELLFRPEPRLQILHLQLPPMYQQLILLSLRYRLLPRPCASNLQTVPSQPYQLRIMLEWLCMHQLRNRVLPQPCEWQVPQVRTVLLNV